MGALRAATDAADRSDARALYRVLDQRARFAMAATVRYRRQGASLIEAFYPTEVKSRALDDLGDARFAKNAEDLFVRRCNIDCLKRFRAKLGTAASVQTRDRMTRVITQRGGEVYFYRDTTHRYGLVWHSDELEEEKVRAARDLSVIQHNVDVLKRRKALGYTL